MDKQLFIPGDILSLRFESGSLRREFGALLWHQQNIIFQTYTNIVLFSDKNTISNQSNVTVIHQKLRAQSFTKNLGQGGMKRIFGVFLFELSNRQHYLVLKLSSTQIRRYSPCFLKSGHNCHPKSIQSQMVRCPTRASEFSLSNHENIALNK